LENTPGLLQAISRFLSSRPFRVFLALAVGFFFLYLAVKDVSWSQVSRILSGTDLQWLGLALLTSLGNNFIKTFRWSLLLKPSGVQVPQINVSRTFFSAQLMNILLPIRIGEISRVVVISKYGVQPAFVIGTILIEKYLDFWAYLLLILSLFFIIRLPAWVDEAISGLFLLASMATIFIMLILYYRGYILNKLEKIIGRFSSKYASTLFQQLQAGIESLDVFRRLRDFLPLALFTTLIWVTAVITNQFVFMALGLRVPLEAAILTLIAVVAGVSIPALPGKIGVFEYASILALGLFGLDQTTSLTYGILLHIVVFFPLLLLGLPSYIHMQIHGLNSASG
jgi:uncharacterized protein (TIRG00374 family)